MPHDWYVPGRTYQKVRDPESLLIEERAKAHAEAGYPLPELDSAMNAENIIQEAKRAAGKGIPD
jgi:hypothetical protein